ncbi:hypothetical protein PsorP6_002674 [Peronosclerospora sorghi]|uniref:Uncharacterized protein n=1 Tax=Peronosclerospora sorghi TaxID=230839 RepID=A0ACC0WR01_9STRA|nr:hypothetical protein PsorP6_002674 [Peronosclerospora sorghi]
MVRVQVMTVRTGAKLCEEHRLKARFLPLRINLDQELVKFLRQFVPMDDEASTWKTLKRLLHGYSLLLFVPVLGRVCQASDCK